MHTSSFFMGDRVYHTARIISRLSKTQSSLLTFYVFYLPTYLHRLKPHYSYTPGTVPTVQKNKPYIKYSNIYIITVTYTWSTTPSKYTPMYISLSNAQPNRTQLCAWTLVSSHLYNTLGDTCTLFLIAKLSLYKTQYRLINLLVTDFYREVSYNISTSVYLRNLAAIEHALFLKIEAPPDLKIELGVPIPVYSEYNCSAVVWSILISWYSTDLGIKYTRSWSCLSL